MTSDQTVTRVPTDHTKLVLTAGFPQFSAIDLFAYFTQPDLLTQWWPQEVVTEPHPGGRYQLSWPAMNWQLFGEYLAYEPGRRLVFSWQWVHQPELPRRQVDIVFSSEGVGSHIILTHGLYTDNQQDQEDRQGHWDGWNHFLGKLQQLGQSEVIG